MPTTAKHTQPAEAPAMLYKFGSLENAPKQQRSRSLSLRILAAAEQVLRREGLDGFTINDVAREGKVSIGGIYGRFKNRDELLTAIHEESLDRVRNHIRQQLARPFGSLVEAGETFAVAVVDIFRECGDLIPVAGKRLDPTSAGAIVPQTERFIRETLTAAIAPFRGEMRHSDPDLAIRLVVHLILASVVRESGTDPVAQDRLMGWDALRAELPKVACCILTGR